MILHLARIVAVVQQVLADLNLQIRQKMQAVSLTSTLLTVSQPAFKLEEIRYFDSELNTQYSEDNIINDQIDMTESSYQTSQHNQLVRI